jgi:hypothetical protein
MVLSLKIELIVAFLQVSQTQSYKISLTHPYVQGSDKEALFYLT